MTYRLLLVLVIGNTRPHSSPNNFHQNLFAMSLNLHWWHPKQTQMFMEKLEYIFLWWINFIIMSAPSLWFAINRLDLKSLWELTNFVGALRALNLMIPHVNHYIRNNGGLLAILSQYYIQKTTAAVINDTTNRLITLIDWLLINYYIFNNEDTKSCCINCLTAILQIEYSVLSYY